MRRIFSRISLLVVLSVVSLWGCGGSGGGTNSTSSQGSYSAQTGSYELLVAADASGNVNAQISTGSGIAYSGTGTVTNAGAFKVTLTKVGDNTKTVTLTGTTTAGVVTFTMSGDLTATGLTGSYTAPTSNVYQGNYSGTYGGGAAGTFQFTVATDGSLTGSASYGTGSVSLSGKLSAIGGTGTPVSGTVGGANTTVTFTGSFFLDTVGGKHAAGNWNSSDGTQGTWTTP